MLKISDTLSFPLDAVTQTFGNLGVRGSGKSNMAAVMAEQMFHAGLPFVVIDVVGGWYGLRSNATGTGPGLSVPIFGGRHGDIPLERTAGVEVADLVVDERATCVLDLSEFSEGDKIRFLIDFAERLYRRNEAPLHLFLEEADDYIPQRPFREQARLLRAWENIVRRGRARGLGMTMITQRSAAINKSVLTQVETLCVFRTTSPNDRKAVQGWVDYHGTRHDVLATLPSLANGEAWIWSPNWLRTFERVTVHRRTTFDSGATPKAKSARKAATLADIDPGAVRARFAATIERAKADDPKELRKEIGRLQRELATRPAPAAEVRTVEKPVLTEEQHALLDNLWDDVSGLNDRAEALAKTVTELQGDARRIADQAAGLRASIAAAVTPQGGANRGSDRGSAARSQASAAPARPQRQAPAAPARRASEGNAAGLTGPEQRIVDAIAWLNGIGVAEPEQVAVAFLAGYTYGGGAFNNPRGALRTKGLVEYLAGDRIRLTEGGAAAANAPDAPLSVEELHARVLERLPGPESRLLLPLLRSYPAAMSNEELAAAAGYTAGAGAYNNPRGRLRSLGLVEYPAPGQVVARSILFLEGR